MRFLKRIELKLGILVGGADSRISDNGQPMVLSHNPVVIWVLILPGYETGFETRGRVVEPGSTRSNGSDVSVASTHRFRDRRTCRSTWGLTPKAGSAFAVPAPTRARAAAPRPATATGFFIVRDFFSFAFVCRSVGWPSVSSIPQRLVPRQRARTVSHAAEGDEAGRFHW
jgi:hypothetical protein